MATLDASTTDYGSLTAANASSTDFSNFGTAYFGGTATSTFSGAGQLSLVPNGLTVGTDELVVSGGNVGVGTTSPFAALSVVGNIFGNNITGTDLTATGTVSFSGIPVGSLAVTSTGSLYSFSTSTWTFASSTLLGDSNTFTHLQSFANASTTLGTISTLWLPNVSANSLAYLNGNNQVEAAAVSFPLGFSGGTLSLAFSTTTANTWSQLQTLQSGFVSQASSTVVGNFTTTGTNTFGGASNFTGLGTWANGFLSQASSTIVGPLTLTGTLSAQGATFAAPLSLTSTTGTTTIASGQGLTVGGSQFVIQQGSGDVGVGTAMPIFTLQVSGTDHYNLDGGTGGLALSDAVTPTEKLFEGLDSSLGTNGSGYLQAVKTGVAYDPLLLNPNGGNVSIGTTGPNAPLTVHIGTNRNLYVENGQINSSALDLAAVNDADTGNVPMELDASSFSFQGGNVGIGTTTPSANLDVIGSTGGNVFVVRDSTSGHGGLVVKPQSTYVEVQGTDQQLNAVDTLALNPEGGSVYLDTTSNPLTADALPSLGILASTGYAGINLKSNGSNDGENVWIPITSGSGLAIGFESGSSETYVGGISVTTSGTTYNTTSDRRLKTDIATTTEGLSTLMQIPVFNFAFKNDPNKTIQQGFIAQTLEPVYPEAVTTNGDNGIVPLGATSTPWQVDYGRITPLIVSAVQDIANISSTFEQNLIAWLGNAQNGIGDLFAENLHAQTEICINSTCVNQQQLAALLSVKSAGGEAGSTESVSSQADSNSPPGSSVSATSSAPNSSPGPAASGTPPQIQINGDNPAVIQVGAAYSDLGATIAGPSQDLNLGIRTFLNGSAMSPVVLDTSAAATDTISYVVTDQNGLTATTTRTVIVEAPTVVRPEATTTEANAATSSPSDTAGTATTTTL